VVITYTFDPVTASWVEDAGVVTDDTAQLGDRFGASVAMAGDYMAVGAPGRVEGLFDAAGSVSIFRWDSGTSGWVFVDRIVQFNAQGADAPEFDAQFGTAVDLTVDASGTYTLAIGAPTASGTGSTPLPATGAVFLLESNGDLGDPANLDPWPTSRRFRYTAEFEVPNSGTDSEFGAAVTVENGILVAGAPQGGGSSNPPGSVYIYERGADDWPPSTVFGTDPSDFAFSGTTPNGAFGVSIDQSSGTLAIGAPRSLTCCDPTPGECDEFTEGTVFLYDRSSDLDGDPVWTQTIQLTSGCCSLDTRFGASVAISGDNLVTGAPGNGQPGFVSRFNRAPGGTWFPTSRIDAAPAIPTDSQFGSAVAIRPGSEFSPAIALASGPLSSANLNLAAGSVLSRRDATTASDCDGDGVDDALQLAAAPAAYDCNGNGSFDACDIAGGSSSDCNDNGVPDDCEDYNLAITDCNNNGIFDACDIDADPSLDCNGNDIIDSCEFDVAEIVFIVDTSGSQGGKSNQICVQTIDAILSELVSRGIRVDHQVLAIDDPGNFGCNLTEDDTVYSRYGRFLPGPASFAPWPDEFATGDESWTAAAAIVADQYPWRTTLRIVVPISDECGWQGGSTCNSDDADALDAALDALTCRDVMAMPIQFKNEDDEFDPGVAAQMSRLATGAPTGNPALPGTGGAFFQADGATLITAFADAVEVRLSIHDHDQLAGGVVGNGILDSCELDPDDSDTLADCNRNRIDDSFEIAFGMSLPGLTDPSRPRECGVPCSGDVDSNEAVDFSDLLAVLAAFGPCPAGPPCPADIDGNGAVDFSDLLTVLASWGPCRVPPSCQPFPGAKPSPPGSILECLQKYGSDPVKLQKCIEAMILADTP
jgi:hypothetical protein